MNRLNGTSPLERYQVADASNITPGQLVALNGDGKAVPAADTAGLKVVGIAKDVSDGYVEVFSGIVSLANGSSGAARGVCADGSRRGRVCRRCRDRRENVDKQNRRRDRNRPLRRRSVYRLRSGRDRSHERCNGCRGGCRFRSITEKERIFEK